MEKGKQVKRISIMLIAAILVYISTYIIKDIHLPLNPGFPENYTKWKLKAGNITK